MSIFFVAIFWHSFFAFSTKKELGGTYLTACFSLLCDEMSLLLLLLVACQLALAGRQAGSRKKVIFYRCGCCVNDYNRLKNGQTSNDR